MKVKRVVSIILFSLLGAVSVIAIFSLLQIKLDLSDIKAAPASCTVDDDLVVKGILWGGQAGGNFTLMPVDPNYYVQIGYGGTPRNLYVWGELELDKFPCQIEESGQMDCEDHCISEYACSGGRYLLSCGLRKANNADMGWDTINCYVKDETTCVCEVHHQGPGHGYFYIRNVCCF